MNQLEMDELGDAWAKADDLEARKQVVYAILELDLPVEQAWQKALDGQISVPEETTYSDETLYHNIINHGSEWSLCQQQQALRGQAIILSPAKWGPQGWGL